MNFANAHRPARPAQELREALIEPWLGPVVRLLQIEADGWLGELTLREGTLEDETIALTSRWGRRASDLGLLPISLESYLRLLEWTARQLRSGQRSTVPILVLLPRRSRAD